MKNVLHLGVRRESKIVVFVKLKLKTSCIFFGFVHMWR